MRTKTRAVKFRPSNSIPPLNPSLISLPFLYQDEPNEEYQVDGNDHGASKGTGSSQDNDNNNNNDVDSKDYDYDDEYKEEDDDGGSDGGADDNIVVPEHDNDSRDAAAADSNGDYVKVVIPDSVEEVDRRARGSHAAVPSEDFIVVDWLERELRIRCNSRGGQVLVCCENGCPVAIHEACMNCEPNFDDMGIFYCPYCWYKRQLARTKELRRDGGNEEKQEDDTEKMKAASVSTNTGKINTADCENGMNDDDNETIHHNQDDTSGVESLSKEKSDEQNISRAHGFENIVDGERVQEEDIEHTSDSEDDEINEDRLQIVPFSSNHLGIVEGAIHVSTKEISDVVGVLEEDQGNRGKGKSVIPNAVGTTMAVINGDAMSKVPAIESFEFISTDLDTETLAVRQKRFKRTAQRARPLNVYSPKNLSFQQSTNVKDKNTNQHVKATVAKNSVQCQESTKRMMTPIVGTGKRRRLHWTAEEEDMLKEGVRRFSTTMNKNIPWRKILEFGHNVFNTTRTPADLKDKWKNIMAKEAPKSNSGNAFSC